MNISFKISIILVMLFAVVAPRCHGMSDFAGQGKASGIYSPDEPVKVILWDDVWTEDPSRAFSVPGGRLSRSNKVTAAPTVKAKPENKPDNDQPVKPDDAADCKPEPKPRPPHIPMVKPPKPEVKPKPKPDCKPKPEPEVKPDEHKCWPFHFRPVKHDCTPKAKPDCKHETAKPDKKPSCSKGVVGHKKSECSKPNHPGPTPSNPGKDSSCGKSGGLKGDRGPGVGRRGHGR